LTISDLAKESQQEFVKSGSSGTCIEARELIIALPEVYTEYDPQKVLEMFTSSFHEQHGVECVSALHHNKRKTNYHIHLIFSERKRLDEPIVKIASRNMFYDEKGKHVRTKKEIADANGEIKAGCKITYKGEVYEQQLFSNKDPCFKGKKFLEDEKKHYTELMNCYIKNPEQKLAVFEKNSVYLPTKKIGKNNPKAKEIAADNRVRTEWNQTADMALIEGVPVVDILDIKKKGILQKVKASIQDHGKQPGLFKVIVLMAKNMLIKLIRKFKLPPKPQLTVDIQEFREMQDIHAKLVHQAKAIQKVEQQIIPELKDKQNQLKGVFKKKERNTVEKELGDTEVRLTNMKVHFEKILLDKGFKSVQDFMQVYQKSEELVYQYQHDLQNWKEQVGAVPPKKGSVRDQIRQYQSQMKSEDSKMIKKRVERGAR